MTLHASLAEAELHENKGVSTASNNTVASATSGETVWRKVNADMIDNSSIFNINEDAVTLTISDVSTPEVVFFYVPYNCTLAKVGTVLGGAITLANSVITVKNNAGASAGTITIAHVGSAAGDIDELVPTSNNTFTAGQRLSIETDGASTTAAKLFITLMFTVTG